MCHNAHMSGPTDITVGDRGRIVLPAAVRQRAGLEVGTKLCLLETPNGLVLLTRAQLRERVRKDLAGVDLLESLLEDRRRAAESEDRA